MSVSETKPNILLPLALALSRGALFQMIHDMQAEITEVTPQTLGREASFTALIQQRAARHMNLLDFASRQVIPPHG